MDTAEEAEMPLSLLTPLQRPLRLTSRQHGLVPMLHDKAHLLQERRCPGRYINVASVPDHALDHQHEVPAHREHPVALAVYVLHRLPIRHGTLCADLGGVRPIASRMGL